MQKDLMALPGIGEKISEQLLAVGIETAEALRAVGAKEAWLRILAIDDSACYNRLMSLEGAVRDVPKGTLPEDVRADLRVFYRQAKG